jgi:hypothetical protein
MVEKALGFSGDETMYVGDHIYTDVSVSKVHLRWRTALVCRELEREVRGVMHYKVVQFWFWLVCSALFMRKERCRKIGRSF